MTEQMQSLRDDIAYMKTLAVAGRQGQILGGSILLLTGVIFGTTSFISWAIQLKYLPALPGGIGLEWGVAVVLHLLALLVLIPAVQRRARAVGAGDNSRLFGAVWSSMGLANFVAAAACVAAFARMQDFKMFLGYVPMIMVLYAMGWNISAAISRQRWMRLVALGSALAAVLLGWTIATNAMYLVFGASTFLFMALPGLKLVQRPAAQA